MKNDSTAPGGKQPGAIPKYWPDRRDLAHMQRLCSAATAGLRRPAVTYPFEITAARLQSRITDWESAWRERREEPDATAMFNDYTELMHQLEVFFARQKQFALNCDLILEHHNGIKPHDEDGLLVPGLHLACWEEFSTRFDWSARRSLLLNGLLAAALLYKQAGANSLDVGGSFVTLRQDPKDIDCSGDVWQCLPSLHGLLRRWPLRRRYFGLDLALQELALHHRTLVDPDFDDYNVFNDTVANYVKGREVGVVRLDLKGHLPEPEQFVPFAALPGDPIAESEVEKFRAQAPQHWRNVTDDVLAAHGVCIIRQPWLRRASPNSNDKVDP